MDRTPVCCTAYTSPNDLWLQIRWDGGQQLKSLMVAATKWAAADQTANVPLSTLSSNKDWVLVRPNNWNLWFRARLLGPVASDKSCCQVQLVDFGNRLYLPQSPDRLLPMPEFFGEQKLPSCAVPCRLARISQRRDWSKRDAKLLEELLTMTTEDRILDAEFDWEKSSANAPTPVELYQRGSELSINDAFGNRTGSLIAKLRSGQVVNFLPANPTTLRSMPPVQQNQPINDFDNSWDQPFNGMVSHVTDKGIVFVQKDEKLLSGLQSQLELLSDSEDLVRFSASSLPDKDEIFAVFQEPPLRHYRGRVLELLGGQRVKLLIIDFGFELIVDWNQCAKLPGRIRYKPQCCPFLPVRQVKTGDPGVDRLSSLWKEVNKNTSPVRVTVTPTEVPDMDPVEVQTARIDVHLNNGGREDIVDFLLSTGASKCADTKTVDLSTCKYRNCREELNWDVDNIVCGTCTHVETENSVEQFVFFQPNTMQAVAEQLKLKLTISTDKLEKYDATSFKQLPTPVLVQKDEDGANFQRATVDNVDKTTCDVTYVDMGKRQQGVPIGRLYKLPSDLLTLPTICVKCQLINKATGSETDEVKVGDIKIFTIVGVADGAYKIAIVGTGN
ncbi:hypothetical protein BOX15_Mlig029508g1 [Macrostomum lignano]|uniref:Tudor domain-containing protein n=1 Tax=Macrostomum lignano TaxID=282301 RepID=A0A267H860_9PLAT|nr:hypothetical protein BOX15_Mlig029508g1 [Macrostomum lignano]